MVQGNFKHEDFKGLAKAMGKILEVKAYK